MIIGITNRCTRDVFQLDCIMLCNEYITYQAGCHICSLRFAAGGIINNATVCVF